MEIDFLLGLVTVILFRYKNQIDLYKNIISGFILGLFVSKILFDVNAKIGVLLYFPCAIGLLVFYILRFLKKEKREIIDNIKIVGIVLLLLYPVTYYMTNRDNAFPFILNMLTFPALFAIFIYDKIILKGDKMKQKHFIIILIQTVIIFTLLIFAFYQKAEADRQRSVAFDKEKEAKELYMRLQRLEINNK